MSIWEDIFGPREQRYMPETWSCQNCGGKFFAGQQHYCGSIKPKSPATTGAQIAKPLTEEDVRRIVREEFARLQSNGPENPT